MAALNRIALHLKYRHMQRKKMETTSMAIRMFRVAPKPKEPTHGSEEGKMILHVYKSRDLPPKNQGKGSNSALCKRQKNQKLYILLKVC